MLLPWPSTLSQAPRQELHTHGLPRIAHEGQPHHGCPASQGMIAHPTHPVSGGEHAAEGVDEWETDPATGEKRRRGPVQWVKDKLTGKE